MEHFFSLVMILLKYSKQNIFFFGKIYINKACVKKYFEAFCCFIDLVITKFFSTKKPVLRRNISIIILCGLTYAE